MKKIYIAGKISGECESPELMQQCLNKFNNYGSSILKTKTTEDGFVKFVDTEDVMFTHGLIINHSLINSGSGTWDKYMKNDITIMVTCDEVHFLPDWINSKGAKVEHQLCIDLEIPIVYA